MSIPQKDLVGKNARIEEKGVYRDDYLDALNKFAPVDEVFGKDRKAIAKGEWEPVANLVMDTLGKAEWENHLVAIVMTAAKEGEWRAVPRGPQHQDGLDEVVEKKYGFVVNLGKKFLVPSAFYVNYCLAQKKD